VAAWADTAALLINIDHHVTNPGTAAVQLLDPKAAATGEIIYDLLQELQLEPDTAVATLLYAAIMSDTGSFRFSNTNARVLEIAAYLVRSGASPPLVARELYEKHTWGYMKALQSVLQTLNRSEDGRVAWLSVTADTLARHGVRQDESEGLVQYPRMIEGVEVAVVFREIGSEEVRVGFRSKGCFDVSRVAREFGGGGHPRASGCTLHRPLERVRGCVLTRISELLAQSG
jgi:phosphoesterase RecJ-like protein